jgi:hypothetical protein
MNSKSILVIAAAALAVLAGASPAPASGYSQTPEELFAVDNGVREVVRPPRTNQIPPEGGGGGTCWGKQLERSEGGFPYGRRLYLYTIWCGSGGTITYRSSTAWTSHDFSCWTTNGPHVAKTYGGAGWGMVEVQAWAEVACHSPSYWPTWHDTLMMRVRYYPNGWYQTVAWD